MTNLHCALCQTLVPMAKSSLGKTLVGGLASYFGLARTKSIGGTLALGFVGVVVGHLVDLVIDEVTRPVCDPCRTHGPAWA